MRDPCWTIKINVYSLLTNIEEKAYTQKMNVNIELLQSGVLNLLTEMERLDLIRLNIPNKNIAKQEKKLSKQFAGSIHLSDVSYELFQNNLQESRNEWTQNI